MNAAPLFHVEGRAEVDYPEWGFTHQRGPAALSRRGNRAW